MLLKNDASLNKHLLRIRKILTYAFWLPLKQEINNKLSLGIGVDGQFAHKTGEFYEQANHDMGIVYMKGHHDYIICCFSSGSNFDKALFNMKEISEFVYNYFETT